MKTKKVLWGFLITMLMIGCSTDDTEIYRDQLNNQNPELHSKTIYSSGDSYGLPLLDEDKIVSASNLIEIKYLTRRPAERKNIREKFSRRHPLLGLVKPANSRSPIETWYLRNPGDCLYVGDCQGSGSIQNNPEEDEDLDIKNLYHTILLEITEHPLINISNVEEDRDPSQSY